jgi:hypothetical protein
MKKLWQSCIVKHHLLQVEHHALSCRRPPGEPKLTLELQRSSTAATTSAEAEVDQRERARRAAVAKSRLSLRLIFNHREACQTAPLPLNDDFEVAVGSIFPLKIMQWPESLKLQVRSL